MSKVINISNKKFGRLTAISFSHIFKGRHYWNCLCNCGKKVTIQKNNLLRENTKSCGCLSDGSYNRSHGMSDTKEYRALRHMKQRCYNKKDRAYNGCGGRGIKICKRWLNSFENFYKDMGDCPKGSLLGRLNNNGDYKPSNCLWIAKSIKKNI